MPQIDALVLGGGMYPGYEQYWSAVHADPQSAEAARAGSGSVQLRVPLERVAGLSVLGGEQFPVPLGDDFDGTIGHFDGGLIVNRVPRHRHAGGPFSAAATELSGMFSRSRCGNIAKSTSPSVLSPPVGGFQPTKSSPMLGAITMLPALNSHVDRLAQRRQEVRQSGLPHAVAQIQGIAPCMASTAGIGVRFVFHPPARFGRTNSAAIDEIRASVQS
jgi:hypothetical protein